MIAINTANMGFDPSGLVTVRVDLPEWRYKNDASIGDYYSRLLARLNTLSGVQGATATDRLPVLGGEAPVQLTIDGYSAPREQDRPWAGSVITTEDFLAVGGIRLIAGREFTPADTVDRAPVAIVNEEMARRYWGDPQKALGSRVKVERDQRGWIEIVGIAGNVKTAELNNANPVIYRAARQLPVRGIDVLVRGADPDRLLAAMRSEMTALDRDIPLQKLRTVREAFKDEMSSLVILSGMFMSFAAIALVLAASGLYGVISYSVSQRAQEIGIRLALGATVRDIRSLIVRQTAFLIGTGCVLGLLGGIALAQSTSALLYDVSPSDPSTYVVVAFVLASVAGSSRRPRRSAGHAAR
jgi:predicted permease